MIQLNSIVIHRAIVHHIRAKEAHQDHSSAVYSNELFTLNAEVSNVIRERLVASAGKHSKAFELNLLDTDDGSFFSVARELRSLTDEEFVRNSQTLAAGLSESQRRIQIPGGYLLVLDCSCPETGPVQIVIKAQPHEALKIEAAENQLTVLHNGLTFHLLRSCLKLGILFRSGEDGDGSDPTNFGCFFSTTSSPLIRRRPNTSTKTSWDSRLRKVRKFSQRGSMITQLHSSRAKL